MGGQSADLWSIYLKKRVALSVWGGASLLSLLSLDVVWAAEEVCIDYYTVGESKCQPAASTPIAMPEGGNGPQLAGPSSSKKTDPVEDYLANYGKPPREFVEFYLNPTAENAQKWVTTYQGILQRGQELSRAWGDAEELYKSGISPTVVSPKLAAQPVQSQGAVPVTEKLAPSSSVVSFGAFAPGSSSVSDGLGGVRMAPIGVTYYYSQTCPYCTRLTPELSLLSKEMSSKLELTCVDVTPLGVSSRPDEGFITSKLPCKWRLPEQGEVESVGVRQTPTLMIQKEGKSPMKLSGYVPLAQLRKYFE